MKPSTAETYLERIDRVVGFLSDHVENAPSLKAMANIAAISPYHFHRVYRAITGETPSNTLRRLRLAKACVLLKDAEISITRIAFDVGYDSLQSFSKAFRTGTGHTPSALRDNAAALDDILASLSSSASRGEVQGNIEVKVVSLEPFNVIASRHRGPPDGLFQAFGTLFEWAIGAGYENRLQGIYGIPLDDPRDVPAAECRFDCCFDFGPDVSGDGKFDALELGGGRYAVTRHQGPYEGIEEKYDYLIGSWVSTSNFSLRDHPIFNHYLKDPETVPPDQWETDLYVPIEPRVN